MSKTISPGASPGKTGVSLIEMLMSLVIFSVVVFPLMEIPMKALDQSEQTKNGSIINFEMGKFFDQFHKEINLSYRFLPFWQIAASGTALDMPTDKQVFIAYWDDIAKTEKRVGYEFKEVFQPAPASPNTSYAQKRWRLMRTEIPADATLDSYIKDSTEWQPVGQVINNDDFYITSAADGDDPMFMYCRGTVCTSAISPDDADGVRVMSNNAGASGNLKLNFVYRNVANPLDPLYFKLASLQTETNRNLADKQVLPFSQAISRWTVNDSWIADRSYVDPDIGTFRIPVDNASQLPGTALPIRDLYYNIRTGDLLSATNSTNTTLASSGLYIFKFKPGFPDYKPYTLSMSSGASYSDAFPVAIHPGDIAWPDATGIQVDFLSVTQDMEDNIYVLARSGSGPYKFWVEKFSPEGAYVSRFSIDNNTSVSSATGAIGITFNPAAPSEVMVLLQKPSAGYRLRAYPKDQNTIDDSERTMTSAESEDLTQTAITPSGFSWTNAKGVEYDSLNNRFLFTFADSANSNNAQILSLDVDIKSTPLLNQDDGIPSVRAITVNSIYQPDSTRTPIQNPTGIAYDPMSNTVYLSTTTGGEYYRIVPDVRLNIVHR